MRLAQSARPRPARPWRRTARTPPAHGSTCCPPMPWRRICRASPRLSASHAAALVAGAERCAPNYGPAAFGWWTRFVGPLDDAWHEADPAAEGRRPPRLASRHRDGVCSDGLEQVAVGDVAQDIRGALVRDDAPAVVARELSAPPEGVSGMSSPDFKSGRSSPTDLVGRPHRPSIDLTQTLSPEFPAPSSLPPEFGQCAPFRHRGGLTLRQPVGRPGTGTTSPAASIPARISTRRFIGSPARTFPDNTVDTDTIPPANFIAPAVRRSTARGRTFAANPDFVAHARRATRHGRLEHGRIPVRELGAAAHRLVQAHGGGLRQSSREDGAHTPGPDPDAVRFSRRGARRPRASASRRSTPMPGQALHLHAALPRRISTCTARAATACNA